MRGLPGALLLLVLGGGCATWSWPGFLSPSSRLLARADRLASAGDYDGAVIVYTEYLARYPEEPDAARVLDTRDTLAGLLTARADLDRLRAELLERRAELERVRADLERARTELAARQADLAGLRQELAARQAEAERLREALERLKQLDLRLERRR